TPHHGLRRGRVPRPARQGGGDPALDPAQPPAGGREQAAGLGRLPHVPGGERRGLHPGRGRGGRLRDAGGGFGARRCRGDRGGAAGVDGLRAQPSPAVSFAATTASNTSRFGSPTSVATSAIASLRRSPPASSRANTS